MERSGACVGRPRKHSLGWQSANNRIYLTKETLADWRRLRSELGISNDNDVAVFLLQRNNILIDFLASEGHRSVSRLVHKHKYNIMKLVLQYVSKSGLCLSLKCKLSWTITSSYSYFHAIFSEKRSFTIG